MSCYLILEVLFYFRYKYLSCQANANIHPYLTQPPISAKQCEYLTSQAVSYGGQCEGGYKKWFEGWFNCKFDQIYEENIRQWLKWAVFVDLPNFNTTNTMHNIHYNSRSSFELNSKIISNGKNKDKDCKYYNKYDPLINDSNWQKEFLDRKVAMVCKLCNIKQFPKGLNKNIGFASNNDKLNIPCFHRPLIFYILIEITVLFANIVLKYWFKFEKIELNGFNIWYKTSHDGRDGGDDIDAQEMIDCTIDTHANKNQHDIETEHNANGVKTGKTQKNGEKKYKPQDILKSLHNPLFFVHGLGIGFCTYLYFVDQLLKKMNENAKKQQEFVSKKVTMNRNKKIDDGRSILDLENDFEFNSLFMIEIPWINMSLTHFLPDLQDVWLINRLVKYWRSGIRNSKSFNKSSFMLGRDVPPKSKDIYTDILQKIEKIIFNVDEIYDDQYQLKLNWNLMGHSYGTFIVSSMYRHLCLNGHSNSNNNRNNNIRLILSDPVSLLLSHPVTVGAVCWNANNWFDYIFQIVTMRELMISITLTRYMHWYDNVIYTCQLIKSKSKSKFQSSTMKNNLVVLSNSDKIVPVKEIIKSLKIVNSKDDLIDYVVFQSMGHAMWLFFPSMVQKTVTMI